VAHEQVEKPWLKTDEARVDIRVVVYTFLKYSTDKETRAEAALTPEGLRHGMARNRSTRLYKNGWSKRLGEKGGPENHRLV
jgi:hypothetical protein